MKANALFFILAFLSSSCIVQVPKYAKVEKVLELQPGMSQNEVSAILGIPPYDLKSRDSTEYTLIYKYRVADRRNFPFFVGQTNGLKWRGKYVDLFITYSMHGKIISIRSCSDCEGSDKTEKKVDINWGAIITLLTVSLPTLLVAFKLSK
jgi:hypothetical protein